MANVNKVILVGRLTRDPETRTFANGGKVAAFGFAVSNRKKNPNTGQWEDDPMFIDCKVFNRGETGQQADRVQQTLHKGNQVFLEGHLVLETWEDKNGGGKRSKHVLVVDNFQYLEPRQDGGSSESGGSFQPRRAPTQPAKQAPAQAPRYDESESHGGGEEGEIPF
jgi:single-strand DNA-binding protein